MIPSGSTGTSAPSAGASCSGGGSPGSACAVAARKRVSAAAMRTRRRTRRNVRPGPRPGVIESPARGRAPAADEHLPGRRQRAAPADPDRRGEPRGARPAGDEQGGVRLRRRRRGHGSDDPREPRRVRPPPDRAADAARRVGPRHVDRAARPAAAVAVPALPRRRAGDGARGRGPRASPAPPPPRACRWCSPTRRRGRWRPSPRALGDSPRWFQLYWSTSDELVESLVRRAEACGCEAIVVTLDTTLLGWRTHDLDLAYLPFLRGKGIAQYTSDPVFRRIIADRAGALGPDEQPRPTPAARADARRSSRARTRTASSPGCAPATRAPPCRRSCASTRARR